MLQLALQKGIVKGALQVHQEAPVVLQGRVLRLQALPEGPGFFDPGMMVQRALPVALQGQEPLRGSLRGTRPEKVLGILPDDFFGREAGVPSQGGPDELVEVVVNAVGVGDKPIGGVGIEPVDIRLGGRPRIAAFPAQRVRKSPIPAGDRVLAADIVGNIRVQPHRNFFRQSPALLGRVDLRPGAVDRSVQVMEPQGPEKESVFGLVESLVGNPNPGIGMEGQQVRPGVGIQPGEQPAGRIIPGIPAGDGEVVDDRRGAEESRLAFRFLIGPGLCFRMVR